MKEVAEGKYFPFVAFHVICMYVFTVTAVMRFLQYILANIEAKKQKHGGYLNSPVTTNPT